MALLRTQQRPQLQTAAAAAARVERLAARQLQKKEITIFAIPRFLRFFGILSNFEGFSPPSQVGVVRFLS